MSLRNKLRSSKGMIRSPFSVPKPEVDSGALWKMLEELAQKVINERMRIFEVRMQEKVRAVEDAATELLSTVPELKDEARETLINHIKTRSIEIRGDDGYTPVKGIDYVDGVDGNNGADSQVPGPQGIPGPEGTPGKDGSPDTPDQVVEKVNTSEKKIAIPKVAGLPEEIAAIKQAIRERRGGGSGGGMGNWLHETFSVSSATTSVTTVSKAAANGMAHILRYNGQVMAYGVQYTVSNKTYTFTFTLDDSSTVDISYVRG